MTYKEALKKLLTSIVDERSHNLLRKNIRDGLFLLEGDELSLEERIAIDDALDTLAIRLISARILTGNVSLYHAKIDVQVDGETQSVRIISTNDENVVEFIDDYLGSSDGVSERVSEYDDEEEEEVDPYSIN